MVFNFNLGKYTTSSQPSSNPRWKDSGNFRAIDRNVLRQSFGNMVYKNKNGYTISALQNGKSKTTPFRTAMSAGDINGTVNMPVDKNALPKPSNPIHSKNLSGLKLFGRSVQTKNNGSHYSGNPKYVYDGADYTRFKKLQAMNRNYNDNTFGGDQHNASFVALNK